MRHKLVQYKALYSKILHNNNKAFSPKILRSTMEPQHIKSRSTTCIFYHHSILSKSILSTTSLISQYTTTNKKYGVEFKRK